MTTEEKILDASNFIFLQYGYHGTTIQKIAKRAEVGKSMVHYYFRSKDNLYRLAIKNVIDLLLNSDETDAAINVTSSNLILLIATELHNNQVIFLQIIDKLYPQDMSRIINMFDRISGNVCKQLDMNIK